MSAVNEPSLRFPVLRFNDAHIRKFKTQHELNRTTQRYLDQGELNRRGYLIDSSGSRFPITRVRKIRRSWHPAFWFAPSPAIVVEVSVGKPTQLSLDEIKATIVDLVCRNHWYRQGGESEAAFRNALDNCQSIAEVMENISFYGDWKG